jgi:integrase/recombinase XerD
LPEKGGKYHEVPAHHKAGEDINASLETAGVSGMKKTPLFRTFNKRRQFSVRRLHRSEIWEMIKRRVRKTGLSEEICCHTFSATGITTDLEKRGTIERAQQIATHESPKTTKLYDRTQDPITLEEVEEVQFVARFASHRA